MLLDEGIGRDAQRLSQAQHIIRIQEEIEIVATAIEALQRRAAPEGELLRRRDTRSFQLVHIGIVNVFHLKSFPCAAVLPTNKRSDKTA
jgi:hypothetical protein